MHHLTDLTRLFAALLPLALTPACGDPAVEDGPARAEQAPGPLGDKADGLDRADHGCAVVLRAVGRSPGEGDFETACTDGECSYVWHGTVDVAFDTAPAAVGVLYHHVSNPTWWAVPASPAAVEGGETPGFRRYEFMLSEHVFGPGGPGGPGGAGADDPIELVAYTTTAEGGRVFDHNRFDGDFENHRLETENGYASFDAGACEPTVGVANFRDDFSEDLGGLLRQGGWLQIRYDLDRLTQCRGTHNGHPAWDVLALGRFLPGGQPVEGSVRTLLSPNGRPTNDAVDRPLAVRVPDDAESVELWFRNGTGAGSSCVAWDSDDGRNYHFPVSPAADDPRCLDVERETGVHTEDPRMAHNAPACLDYALSAQRDAPACGLVLQGLGRGYVGHYGIPYHWLVAHLRVGALGGDVLSVGVFSRFHDRNTGERGQRFSLGMEIEPGLWQAGVTTTISGMMGGGGHDREVEALAFFADVRGPDGRVTRLWNSRGGRDWDLVEVFALPPTTQGIPYGRLEWANDASGVLVERGACGGR